MHLLRRHPATRLLSRAVQSAVCLCALAVPAQAQLVGGPGDDAIPLPRGGFRIGIGARWNSFDEVFTESGRRPLLAGLETDALGRRQLPQLAPVEQAIASLTGTAFGISLGPLSARASTRENVAPLSIEYGVTRRLSVSLVVPYVEARTTTRFVLNPTGSGANVGANPTYLESGAAARAANATVLRELDLARTALGTEIQRCADAGAENCDAIRANLALANELLQSSLQTQQAIGAVYGDSVRSGSLFVPIAGSQAQLAVISRLDALRSGFATFGIESIGATSNPVGSSLVFGPAGFSRIVSDPTYGPGYSTLGNTRSAGIGDVDLGATMVLFDGFGFDQLARFEPDGVKLRAAVSGGWRFGTSTGRRTTDPLHVPTGDGANALLARGTVDLLAGRRFWASASARMVLPMSDRVAFTTRDVTDSTLLFPVEVVSATRELGSRIRLEIAPRYSISRFFGVSAAYHLQHDGSDRFAFGGGEIEFGSRTLHSVALAFSYSSLASYTARRSRIPVEVFYVHTRPIAASGSNVPAVSSERLELRVYTGFPRR